MKKPEIKKGLEGVVMGESRISFIDGKKGKLLYRGYDISDIAQSSYEEVSYLLLHGKLPKRKELTRYSKTLRSKRHLPKRIINLMHDLPESTTPMEALRTTVSALSCDDPDSRKITSKYMLKTGYGVVAKFPTIVASYHRIENELEPVKPDRILDHASNFLYMMSGNKPGSISAKAFNTDLILHAEHGMNASTFAARVTISTLSDMHSAITSAVGTLKGPLHGGAAQEVFRMLRKIRSENNAEKYVGNALAKHEKIMGIGHRVYRTYDPRAVILKKMCKELSEDKGIMKWYNMSDKIEQIMLNKKNLYPNVDFYSSSVYHLLGINLNLDTPIFAISRISGWVAHVMEQFSDNRLIRPRAVYTGPKNLKFIPIDER